MPDYSKSVLDAFEVYRNFKRTERRLLELNRELDKLTVGLTPLQKDALEVLKTLENAAPADADKPLFLKSDVKPPEGKES